MMPNKIGEPENSHNLGVQLAHWSKKKFFFWVQNFSQIRKPTVTKNYSDWMRTVEVSFFVGHPYLYQTPEVFASSLSFFLFPARLYFGFKHEYRAFLSLFKFRIYFRCTVGIDLMWAIRRNGPGNRTSSRDCQLIVGYYVSRDRHWHHVRGGSGLEEPEECSEQIGPLISRSKSLFWSIDDRRCLEFQKMIYWNDFVSMV